ncbi:tyrosine-type recombinase/integrase [Hydrogenimonas thermophila]|uniref:Site-specific recombinase XerD n=1 Tax=Hydrogenimonas thermophila TaxID=223786 RepID=A0A1I5QUX1_9BACT|nr:site-specific integrase [Hydrogenimonas thermophila]SFP50055.1 Site-specific recombinase XerD [Hydrogenimonas thermophila]
MARVRSKKYPGVYLNKLENGDISYSITYKDEQDKKVWLTVGRKSQGITEPFCNQKRNEILNKIRLGEDIPVKHKKRNRYTLQNAFDDYIEWAKVNKKTWEKNDKGTYEKHIEPDFGKRGLTSLTSEDFEKLKTKKLQEGLSPKTVQHILGTARQIINYAIRNKKVKNFENPIGNGRVKMPKIDNQKLGFFTKEQATELLKRLKQLKSKRMYYLTLILLHTGARFSEVASLTWQDVNFDNNLIYFKATKDGKARHIVMSEPLREAIEELYENRTSNLVIPSKNGEQIAQMPRQWQLIVDELIQGNSKAGKYRLTVHSLRHTHASWLAMAGMDLMHIQQQLGHKTIEMTQRYSHLIPDKRHEMTQEIFKKVEV